MERLVGAGYRSVLGVSTRAPEPLLRVAFWSKRPLAFNRSHVPLRDGSRTTSASGAAASWHLTRQSMTAARSGPTRACSEASTD